MYIVKCPIEIENNIWYQSGMCLIAALLEGVYDQIDEKGEPVPFLPAGLIEDIKLDLDSVKKNFVGKLFNNVTLRTIDDRFKVQGSIWWVLTNFETREFMRMGYRFVYREKCPLEVLKANHDLFKIVCLKDEYDKLSYKERELLYQYSIDSDYNGSFMFFSEMFQENIQALDEFNLQQRAKPFSELEWLSLKYSAK